MLVTCVFVKDVQPGLQQVSEKVSLSNMKLIHAKWTLVKYILYTLKTFRDESRINPQPSNR